MVGYGDEEIFQEVVVCRYVGTDGSSRPHLCVVSRVSTKMIKKIAIGFLLSWIFIWGSIAIVSHGSKAHAQESVKIQVIEVTPGFSATIAPGQQVVGFSCAADERSIVPQCYALVK